MRQTRRFNACCCVHPTHTRCPPAPARPRPASHPASTASGWRCCWRCWARWAGAAGRSTDAAIAVALQSPFERALRLCPLAHQLCMRMLHTHGRLRLGPPSALPVPLPAAHRDAAVLGRRLPERHGGCVLAVMFYDKQCDMTCLRLRPLRPPNSGQRGMPPRAAPAPQLPQPAPSAPTTPACLM